MSASPRVPHQTAAPEPPKKIEFGESFTKLFTSGAGRIAEVQKKSIDLAAQQGAEVIDAWKKAVQKLPGAPGLFLLELTGSEIERYAETQKALVDLFLEQSQAFGEMLKERGTVAAKANEGVAKFAQQAVERTVATEKKVLGHAAAQSKAAFETAKKQFGFDGGPMEAAADSIQRGVNAIVESQKELLEMAVR